MVDKGAVNGWRGLKRAQERQIDRERGGGLVKWSMNRCYNFTFAVNRRPRSIPMRRRSLCSHLNRSCRRRSNTSGCASFPSAVCVSRLHFAASSSSKIIHCSHTSTPLMQHLAKFAGTDTPFRPLLNGLSIDSHLCARLFSFFSSKIRIRFFFWYIHSNF